MRLMCRAAWSVRACHVNIEQGQTGHARLLLYRSAVNYRVAPFEEVCSFVAYMQQHYNASLRVTVQIHRKHLCRPTSWCTTTIHEPECSSPSCYLILRNACKNNIQLVNCFT